VKRSRRMAVATESLGFHRMRAEGRRIRYCVQRSKQQERAPQTVHPRTELCDEPKHVSSIAALPPVFPRGLLPSYLTVLNRIRYSIWILCAVLLLAALDKTPDPPALHPHGSQASAPLGHLQQSLGGLTERMVARSSPPASPQSHTLSEIYRYEPVQLEARLLYSGDTSPPLPAS
jgi:hypothetical protein